MERGNLRGLGITPLYIWVEKGNLERAREVLSTFPSEDAKLVDVNLPKTSDGWTPLICASAFGHVDVVRLLLSHGANVESTSTRRMTPLHYASLYGHFEVARALIEAGADVHARDINLSTPLHAACYCVVDQYDRIGPSIDYLRVCQLLVQNGADVNALDNDLGTPLSSLTADEHLITGRYGYISNKNPLAKAEIQTLLLNTRAAKQNGDQMDTSDE